MKALFGSCPKPDDRAKECWMTEVFNDGKGAEEQRPYCPGGRGRQKGRTLSTTMSIAGSETSRGGPCSSGAAFGLLPCLPLLAGTCL